MPDFYKFVKKKILLQKLRKKKKEIHVYFTTSLKPRWFIYSHFFIFLIPLLKQSFF